MPFKRLSAPSCFFIGNHSFPRQDYVYLYFAIFFLLCKPNFFFYNRVGAVSGASRGKYVQLIEEKKGTILTILY